jgi:hypothetical protein
MLVKSVFSKGRASRERFGRGGYGKLRANAGKIEEWQRKADERFMRIEKRLTVLQGDLKRIEIILLKLPQLLQQKIGFQRQK